MVVIGVEEVIGGAVGCRWRRGCRWWMSLASMMSLVVVIGVVEVIGGGVGCPWYRGCHIWWWLSIVVKLVVNCRRISCQLSSNSSSVVRLLSN